VPDRRDLGRWAPDAAAAAAGIACGWAFAAGLDAPDVSYAALVTIAVVAAWAGLGASAAASAVLLAGTYGAQVTLTGDGTPPLLYAVAVPWLIGRVVRSRRELGARLEATAAELEAERATYVELAVERERLSIARDLHDVVGHAMSLVVLQAAAGRHLARHDPQAAAEALAAIADAGREARTEVERLRGVLQAGPAPGLDALGEVVARAAAAGVDVRVRGGGGTASLSPEADRAAFRVVQEALTNALRHAPGAAVEVALERRDGTLVVEVVNGSPRDLGLGSRAGDGAHREGGGTGRDGGGAGRDGGGGHGVRNMAERVAAVGGRLDAGPRDDGTGRGGWRVRATLPVDG
jgi:signal transduction histidine kinase